MYYLHDMELERRRMRNAVAIALGLHLLIVSVVSFKTMGANAQSRQIEVTLTTSRADRAPDDARHIAQQNQLGSGDQAPREAMTAPDTTTPASAAAAQQAPPPADTVQNASGELLSTVAAADQAVTPREQREQKNTTPGITPEAQRLEQALAALQARPDPEMREQSRDPRVRRLTSVSARQAADAAYLLDWRQRLEAVGNKYYPEASIRYGMYGDLRLLVAIRSDGSLQTVKVLQSSGYAVLDEAAIKIVRMAAPYSPFPPELAATTDTLEIVRTWQFRDHTGAG